MTSWTLQVTGNLSEVVCLGALEAVGVPSTRPPAIDEAIDQTVAWLRRDFAGSTAGQIPHLQAARQLYRSIGIDPTRHRPSPEALTRRLLRGDVFPRVHPAVDLSNLWAISSGLPVGLYDADRLDGTALEARLGGAGESFEGIRKGDVHLEGRFVLADGSGPFGNPTSDSARTAVSAQTRHCLFVMFATGNPGVKTLETWLEWLDTRVPRWLEASTAARFTS